jgi:hypothetical protein
VHDTADVVGVSAAIVAAAAVATTLIIAIAFLLHSLMIMRFLAQLAKDTKHDPRVLDAGARAVRSASAAFPWRRNLRSPQKPEDDVAEATPGRSSYLENSDRGSTRANLPTDLTYSRRRSLKRRRQAASPHKPVDRS